VRRVTRRGGLSSCFFAAIESSPSPIVVGGASGEVAALLGRRYWQLLA